jgi:hypothetical protein
MAHAEARDWSVVHPGGTMKERQVRELNRLRRVIQFAKASLAEERRFDSLVARLEAVVARCVALREEQAAARRLLGLDTHDIRPLRSALRERHLIPIGRAGKRLMKFAPGAERAFAVPKKRATMAALLEAAESMLKYVQRHARLFIGSGFEKDFVARLRLAIEALRERTSRAGKGRQRGTRATASLKRELSKGNDMITILDALLGEKLHGDGVLATLWRHASRVEKRLGRPKLRRRKAAHSDPGNPGDLDDQERTGRSSD